MSSQPASAELGNPYPGLRPFDVHEFESFFGRDQQVDELLVRLRERRFVAIVGLSGSGKSSLVRAGLIHRLQVGHLTSAGSRWHMALFRPGSHSIDALAAALDGTLGEVPDRAAELRKHTQQLLYTTRFGREAQENLLLVVDQFEEIFRFHREEMLSQRDAAHFIDLLLAVEQDLSPDYRIYVVLTMRTDYLGDCAQFDGLPEALNRSQYLVPRLTRDQARDAIEGPAALVDTEVTSDILQTLLVESGEGRDTLPLLQHALMRLWEKREPASGDGWRITLAHYRELGGMAQALNDHADATLSTLSDDQQQLVKRIFQELTEVGQGRDQRRPMRLSALVKRTGATLPEVTAAVDHFLAASFLTSPDREREEDWEVDISHESLIRQWKTLSDWTIGEAQDRDDYLYFAKRVERGGGLLTDADLALALQWQKRERGEEWAKRYGGDFAGTNAFIERSRKAHQEHLDREEEQRGNELHRAELRAQAERTAARRTLIFSYILCALLMAALILTALVARKARQLSIVQKATDSLERDLNEQVKHQTELAAKINSLRSVQGATAEERDKIAREKAQLEAQYSRSLQESQKLAQPLNNLQATVKILQNQIQTAQQGRDEALKSRDDEAARRKELESQFQATQQQLDQARKSLDDEAAKVKELESRPASDLRMGNNHDVRAIREPVSANGVPADVPSDARPKFHPHNVLDPHLKDIRPSGLAVLGSETLIITNQGRGQILSFERTSQKPARITSFEDTGRWIPIQITGLKIDNQDAVLVATNNSDPLRHGRVWLFPASGGPALAFWDVPSARAIVSCVWDSGSNTAYVVGGYLAAVPNFSSYDVVTSIDSPLNAPDLFKLKVDSGKKIHATSTDISGLDRTDVRLTMAVDSRRSIMFVADKDTGSLYRVDLPSGRALPVQLHGKIGRPAAIGLSSDGKTLFSVDGSQIRATQLDVTPAVTKTFLQDKNLFSSLKSLAVESDGQIWVGDDNNHAIYLISPKGEVIQALLGK